MVRLCGRCPCGERLIGRVRRGIGDHHLCGRASPQWHESAVHGSMNGAKFLAYQCLAPTLKRKDIVMIDNFLAHKAAGIREAIEGRVATLRYLLSTRSTSIPSRCRSAS
jgi:hypothetical protein